MKRTYITPQTLCIKVQPQLMQSTSILGSTDQKDGNLSRQRRGRMERPDRWERWDDEFEEEDYAF